MEHLNYCRQMVKQFSASIAEKNFPAENKRILSHAIDLANVSQKFLLPDGGRVYDDPEYRALDESEPLRLPYKFIALEYSRRTKTERDAGKEHFSTKAIVFARERDEDIALTPIIWIDSHGIWGPMPEISIPKVGYLDRSQTIGGYTAVNIRMQQIGIPVSDYGDEVGAMLCFLNVLRCKNVHTERSEPKNNGKKIKSAIPFDTYHILTIDAPSGCCGSSASGGHRSPREHLRRGHIRRLSDGRRIWVNATVVAAGKSVGVITKDYAVR